MPKKRVVICSTAIIAFLLFIFLIWFHTNLEYNNTLESMKPISIEYSGQVIDGLKWVNADYVDRFTDANRTYYFGTLDDNSQFIKIIIPTKATLTVYPNDDNSVLLNYKPHKGISRNYKLSGYGDFNKHLKILYEMTGDEIFNDTIDLPKAEQ